MNPPGRGHEDSVLVVSGNEAFRHRLAEELRERDWLAEEAYGGADALQKLSRSGGGSLLLDRWLPDLEISELIELIRARFPHAEVWVVDSRTGEVILPKRPPESHPWVELLRTSGFAAADSGIGSTPSAAPSGTSVPPLPGMLGNSPAMQEVYRLARLVAPRDTSVLIMGETGTGKELVARAIHQLSPRAEKAFVAVNCAAIPEPLLESELFGFVRGAFTGAAQSRVGYIHAANEGSLFLDEVAEIPSAMQAKLLRFLEQGEVQRLGSAETFRVSVRVIAATNARLTGRTQQGHFRSDLYFRLAVFTIDLPPLRARREDVRMIADSFLQAHIQKAGLPPKRFSPAATARMEQYAWPGNVRELRHVVERAFILSEQQQEILPEHIQAALTIRES